MQFTFFLNTGINVNTQNAQWIGALREGDLWTWTDGTAGPQPTSSSIYNNWSSSPAVQPSGDGTCGHMWTLGVQDGEWNDYLPERVLLPFTCEMPVIRRCE